MVTGECVPVEKRPGSAVIAGSTNGSGVIIVRLTKLPGRNTISTIAAMVDEAKLQKPKTQELVDVVASYFVPVITSEMQIAGSGWSHIASRNCRAIFVVVLDHFLQFHVAETLVDNAKR